MGARHLILWAIATLAAGALSALSWLGEGPRAGQSPSLAAGVPRPQVSRREASGAADHRIPLVPFAASGSSEDASAGLDELERAAERALAEDCPEAEEIDALRAVWKSSSPRAAELLATAVRTQSDSSRPESVSVPRFALACLLRDAALEERARRGLASVAWEEGAPAELRALAAAGLAAVAGSEGAREIVFRLRTEHDARVRDAALVALRKNPAAADVLAGWSEPVAMAASVETE
jgi:hypothetical protein